MRRDVRPAARGVAPLALIALALVAPALAAGGCGSAAAHRHTRGSAAHHARARRAARRPVVVRISPSSGGPDTTFSVAYRTRLSIGRSRRLERGELASAHASRSGPGCETSLEAAAPAAAAGSIVTVRLVPAGRLCAGAWRGEILAFQRPACEPGRLCPQLILSLGRQGSFAFRVRASPR